MTNLDGDGLVAPGVASDWTVDSGGKIYEFHLRHDAKWTDGQNVVAQQFVAGLQHAVDPTTGSGSASLLAVIKNASDITDGRRAPDALGVRALDAYTLQIELERPAPFVLQILSEPICAPYRQSAEGIATSQLTNGPYSISERRPGSFVQLAANPHYWNRASVHLQSVKYIIAESEASELRQYLSNQLELTYTLPLSDLNRLRAEHGDEIQTAPILGTMYLALNLSRPDLANKRALREALSIAVDRESITQNLTLGATPAFSFVAQGVQNYPGFKYAWAKLPRAEQISLARSDYEQAGYSPSHPLELTLYFNNNESINRIMVAVADSWKRNLGVETKLVGEEFRVFLDGRKDRSKWDAARLAWLADYNDASSFLEIFTTTGIQNDPDYHDQLFDGLIGKARTEADVSQRSKILSDAEALLLNDYPIVPVYFYSAMHLVKRNVVGASISPMYRTYSRLLSIK